MAEETKNAEQHQPEDDLLLVDRVLAGDRRAFETLVRVHERRLFRVTLAILGNAEDAEEAMQERQARKNTLSLDEVSEAEVKVLPHRGQQWHEDPEKLYGKQEVRVMVEDAIRSLPPIYRETFVLRDVEGLRAEEAAEVLGLTLAAIKSRLLRARLLMREALATRLEETPQLSRKILITAGRMRDMLAIKLMKA